MQPNDRNTIPSEGVCTLAPRMTISQGGIDGPLSQSFESLNRLANTINIQVIALSKCVVGPEFTIDLDGCDTPSFHYIREGHGRLYTPNDAPSETGPHTLIIVPPRCPFRFEPVSQSHSEPGPVQESRAPAPTGTTVFMLCGTFRSLYGASIDLFDTLHQPIIEQFSKEDGLEFKLQLALTELISREVCSDVVVSSTVKQVIVALIRRSVLSRKSWTHRFVSLSIGEQASTCVQENSRKDDMK